MEAFQKIVSDLISNWGQLNNFAKTGLGKALFFMHNRKLNRLPEFDHRSPGYYFVTICVKNFILILVIFATHYVSK